MRLGLIGVLLLTVLLGCSDRTDSWQRIEQSGVLKVGLDPSYPPFESLVDEQLSGIDVDLMQAIAEELGLAVHFDIIGYDGLYDALVTGRVDVLASALIVDETRTEAFAYSEPYFNAGQVLVVQSGTSADAFNDGSAVAVELGAAGHVMVTEAARKGAKVEIVVFDSAESALSAVQTGQAPSAVVDQVSARLYIAEHPSLQIADANMTVEPYAFVVRSADVELLRRLNNALTSVVNDGEADQIFGRYLGR